LLRGIIATTLHGVAGVLVRHGLHVLLVGRRAWAVHRIAYGIYGRGDIRERAHWVARIGAVVGAFHRAAREKTGGGLRSNGVPTVQTDQEHVPMRKRENAIQRIVHDIQPLKAFA
jgi:hypothetical protein